MTEHDDQGVMALQPRKRFPDFDSTGDWVEHKIGDFLTESRQKGSKGDVAKKLTVKLWGKGVFEKDEALTGSANTQYYRRSAGQFIYSKLDFLNQAFGIIPKALDGFESTIDLPCFDIKPGLNPTFLLEYVQRASFYKKNGEVADGGRKAKRIQPEVFFKMPIILPPKLDEQDAIAEAMLSIDALIEAETEKLDALKDHKQGLMQQLFPADGETFPRLRYPEFADQPGWTEHQVSNVASITTGGRDTQNKDDSGMYPFFVRSQNVERINSYSLDCEAVLTSGDGVGVGKNFHYINGKFDFHQRVYCIYNFKPELKGRFFYYFFAHNFFTRVSAMSAKNSVDSVRMAMIAEMPVLLPSLDEQDKITSTLFSVDELIISHIERVRFLTEYKQGLLQKLFPILDEVEG